MTSKIAMLSEKAIDFLRNSDGTINILCGAIRSGKTFISIIRFIEAVKESPYSTHLMSGNTQQSVSRNVLEGEYGMLAILGKRAKFYQNSADGAKVVIKFGKNNVKTIYVVGAHDEASFKKIRGLTIDLWYADEVTLHPQSFINEARGRMSGCKGSKKIAFWTTNPDSPYHYIKKEWIDKAKEKGIKVWHFTMNDNLALDPEYVENQKKAYSGIFYDRMIKGLWVLADGVVYDSFSERKNVVNTVPEDEFVKVWASGDFGMTNATVFLLFGMTSDKRVYCFKEYYYDGKKESKQKTVGELANDFISFVGKYRSQLECVYIDPSAKVFFNQMKADFPDVKMSKAINDVLSGIEMVSMMLSHQSDQYFKYYIHRSCKNTIEEYFTYVWDEKAQLKGEDRPVKANDHAKDAERYALVSMYAKMKHEAEFQKRIKGGR